MEEKKLHYLRDLAKVILFYFLGLSLFFISGFVIITLRVSVKKEVVVPAVVGHMFLEEFNRLSNLGLRIHLETHHSTQYPYGFILAQSLPAGQVVKENTKITLLVNLSEKVVAVPNLIGKSLEFVDSMLGNIALAGRTYRLVRGITLVVPSDKPKGEILEQFPPPGAMVEPNSPVHILVSDSDQKKANLPLVPFNMAARMAYELKKPLSLLGIEKTSDFEKNGFVQIENLNDKIQGKIFKYEANKKKSYLDENELPFRYHWKKLKPGMKEKNYTARLNLDSEDFFSLWFLEVSKIPIPIYVRQEEKIEIYPGYYQNNKGLSPEEVIFLKAGEI